MNEKDTKDTKSTTVFFEDEEGTRVPFEVLAQTTFEEREYLLVQDPEEGLAFILEAEKVSDEDVTYRMVDDDEELRKRIARLQTERNYKQLMESDAHRTARDITRNVVSSTAGKVVGTVAAGAGLYYLKQLADKHGKGEVFEKIYEYGKGGGKKKEKR